MCYSREACPAPTARIRVESTPLQVPSTHRWYVSSTPPGFRPGQAADSLVRVVLCRAAHIVSSGEWFTALELLSGTAGAPLDTGVPLPMPST